MSDKREPKRLLVLDLLRIIAISFVVLQHIPSYSSAYAELSYLPGHGTINIGRIGVALFLVLSGAALEYNGGGLKVKDLANFYKRRLIRLYPAFWLSLVICLFVDPKSIRTIAWIPSGLPSEPIPKIINLFFQDTGMTIYIYIYINKSRMPLINPMGWFIGLILALYLLFPILSRISKKSYFSIVIFFIISLSFKYYFLLIIISGGFGLIIGSHYAILCFSGWEYLLFKKIIF